MSEIYDILIVGGGPGGLSAGIYGSRARLKTVVIEKGRLGGQASATQEIENYPGFISLSGMAFSNSLYEQATALGVEILFEEVTGIESINGNKYVYSEKGSIKRSCKKIIIPSTTSGCVVAPPPAGLARTRFGFIEIE